MITQILSSLNQSCILGYHSVTTDSQRPGLCPGWVRETLPWRRATLALQTCTREAASSQKPGPCPAAPRAIHPGGRCQVLRSYGPLLWEACSSQTWEPGPCHHTVRPALVLPFPREARSGQQNASGGSRRNCSGIRAGGSIFLPRPSGLQAVWGRPGCPRRPGTTQLLPSLGKSTCQPLPRPVRWPWPCHAPTGWREEQHLYPPLLPPFPTLITLGGCRG